MNVIVSNRYAAMLSNLQTKIDLINTIKGTTTNFQSSDSINYDYVIGG